MDRYTIQTISYEAETLLFDGKTIDQFPKNCLVTCGDIEMIPLKSYRLLQEKSFWQEVLHHTSSRRLNFIAPDFIDQMGQMQEPTSESISWFVMFGHRTNAKTSHDGLFPQDLLEVKVDTLSKPDQTYLLDLWRQDYIDGVLTKYSPLVKQAAEESMQTWLQTGAHRLYIRNKQIIGHGCFEETTQLITQTPCLYWHQWVDQKLPVMYRKAIHSRFFDALFSQPLPPMCGVVIANKRSLAHCYRNGMNPTFLSVRLPKI